MSGDLNVALRITSRDDGSKVVSNSLKEVAKSTEAVNKANTQAIAHQNHGLRTAAKAPRLSVTV